MPTLNTIRVETLGEYISIIEDLGNTFHNLWFRGVGSADYNLSPSLYRHPVLTKSSELISRELEILDRFKQRSFPFINRATYGITYSDYWEYFFIMQHFGVPTRLLDWSENPFISLYFALNAARKSDKGDYSNDAAIWILNPNNWNETSLDDISAGDKIISLGDPIMDAYNPQKATPAIRKFPIAIYGNHNSSRIVAQKGTFMLFGTDLSSMNEQFEANGNFDGRSLMKLVIPISRIDYFAQAILKIGVTDSVVYPDLEGLAKEIKRHFEFNF